MRILRLTAENVKRLSVVDIKPDGALVQITGANGSGKSSVLDSIFYALGGKKAVDPEPIRKGAESATIRLDLGEIIVTRLFTGDTTSLVVEAASGARFPSPQKMLDDMMGALTFDPLEFSRMAPKEQLDTLRRLVNLEVDIDTIDGQNRADFENRTAINRRARSADEAVNAAFAIIDPGMDITDIDEAAMVVQLGEAGNHNAMVAAKLAERRELANEIHRLHEDASELRHQAAELIRKAEAMEESATKKDESLQASAPIPDPIDVTELTGKIEEARQENRKRQAQANIRARHAEAIAVRDALTGEADALTARMEERTRIKQAAIAAAKMPVEGLSFGDGGVVFNGVPFEQASSAEQLRVSVALAMAGNPKLRVLRIKDGSLLDDNNLALIAQMADADDYQVWVERVDQSGKTGIVMVDGAVASVN